jgi:nucleotide-binding universal stress UspA family protein
MYRKILVPTDGSRLSDRAVREAARLAQVVNAKLVLFHALPEMRQPIYSEGSSTVLASRQRVRKAAASRARRILAAAAKKAAAVGLSASKDYAAGSSPHDAIVAAAQKHRCDLIVMASHGRRGLSKFLLGSETQAVLPRVRVPVLVVR